MSKHTPGPWYVEEHERQRWNSPTTPTRGVVTQAEHHGSWTVYLIGEVSYPTTAQGSVGALERLANARLIAAAPDLLAACREVAEALPELAADADPRSWYEVRKIQTALSTLLSAAIAKAEGRQS